MVRKIIEALDLDLLDPRRPSPYVPQEGDLEIDTPLDDTLRARSSSRLPSRLSRLLQRLQQSVRPLIPSPSASPQPSGNRLTASTESLAESSMSLDLERSSAPPPPDLTLGKLTRPARSAYRCWPGAPTRWAPAPIPDPAVARDTYAAALREGLLVTRALRLGLERTLRARRTSRWRQSDQEGSVDPSRLLERRIDPDAPILLQQHSSHRLDAAVGLWIDHSDSMRGKRLESAQKAAIVLGETLQRLQIPFEICGYSTEPRSEMMARLLKVPEAERQQGYARFGELRVDEYKRFREAAGPQVQLRLGSMHLNVRENTYDGDSLLLASRRLLQRPELQKLLLVLCDGEPYPPGWAYEGGSKEIHEGHYRAVVEGIERSGRLLPVGIGLHTDSPSRFFRVHARVDRLDDLPGLLLQCLSRWLLGT